MKRLITAAAILVLSGASFAIAQSGGGSSGGAGGSTSTSSASQGRGAIGEAPIGHRQPRRSDVPSERSIDQPDPADVALDRKIKSICRGC